MNNHRKDVKDAKDIPVDKHFNQTGHNFNLYTKFIITEQLQDIEKTSNEILKCICICITHIFLNITKISIK